MKKRLLSCVLIVSSLFCSVPAIADQISDAKNQKSSIDRKIYILNKEKEKEKEKLETAQEKKEDLLTAEEKEQGKYQEVLKEYEFVQKKEQESLEAYEEAEEHYEEQKELVEARLRVMYENSGTSYLSILAESKSITDFLSRMEYVYLLSQKDNKIIEELNMAKVEAQFKKEQLAEIRKAKKQEIDHSVQALNTIKASRAKVESEIEQTKEMIDQYNKQEDDLLKKSQELSNYIKRQQSSGKYTGGSLRWPVPSSHRVVSYFGNRLHPIYRTYRMHTGIDIDAHHGESIVAANNGTVILAGWQSGYGYTVMIDHGGQISTLYAHCSQLLVSQGQKVSVGQVIAKIGSTGLSTGPHLHYEVRVNGSPRNPLSYHKK